MMKSEVNMTLNSLSNTLNSVHIGTCPKPQGKSTAKNNETTSECHISTRLFKKYPFTSRKDGLTLVRFNSTLTHKQGARFHHLQE